MIAAVGSEKRAADGGGKVDVLVLHTANALAVAGSQGALDDLVIGSFVDMQTALDNSHAFRVRINHLRGNGLASQPVGYNESPGIANSIQRWYAHRRWARTDANAMLARNTFQADLVELSEMRRSAEWLTRSARFAEIQVATLVATSALPTVTSRSA